MKKVKKLITALIILTSTTFICLTSLLSCTVIGGGFGVYFTFIHHYKGKSVVDEWHETDTFNDERLVTIQKQKDKDFVILNLADVQMCDLEDTFHRPLIHKEITELVERTHPDLITLTGDQTWSNENLISLKALIRWLDGYKIPYAPVFGNHDYGNEYNSAVASLNYCSDLYENGKYSLFKRGPTNLGTLGNYAINIEEEGKIIKTLYMVDYGYQTSILPAQVHYFNWLADGIKSINNDEYTSSMVFMHKPTMEFFGYQYDESLIQDLKSKGLTDAVAAHYHQINETNEYDNVRYTFACKTGELVFYYDDGENYLNGGTTFTISEDDVLIENHYVDRETYHIKGSDNVYVD